MDLSEGDSQKTKGEGKGRVDFADPLQIGKNALHVLRDKFRTY